MQSRIFHQPWLSLDLTNAILKHTALPQSCSLKHFYCQIFKHPEASQGKLKYTTFSYFTSWGLDILTKYSFQIFILFAEYTSNCKHVVTQRSKKQIGQIGINWPYKLHFDNLENTFAGEYITSFWRQLSWKKVYCPL